MATWFDQRFTNLIQYISSPATPGSPNYVNLGEARSAGLEFEGRALLGSANVGATWTWLDTGVLDAGTGADNLFQQGEPLIRRPAHRMTFSASAPVGSRVSMFTTAVRTGERDDLDFLNDFSGERVLMPAYTVVNLGADVRPLSNFDLTVGVRLENVFDANYREAANFPSAGRALQLTARTGIGF
jgi:outer membrane receptor protein involved in Fe transport